MAWQSEQLDLYFDESGSFTETDRSSTQRFPSQLVGIWAPRAARTPITPTAAEGVLDAAFKRMGRSLPAEVHATTLVKDRAQYQHLVQEVTRQVELRGWQAIRLVNREGVHFGDRAANYTNAVAELVLRLCEARRKTGSAMVETWLYPAAVWLHQEQRLLKAAEYRQRIEQYLVFLGLRRGRAAGTLGGFHFGSGARDRTLQVCDVLSNASKGDYENCERDTRDALQAAFGTYDFTMAGSAGLESIDGLLDAGSAGVALQLLAEQWLAAAEPSAGLEERRDRAIGELAALDGVARRLQLNTLVGWLDVVVEVRRDASLARKIATWLAEHVDGLTRKALGSPVAEPTLDAFLYAVRRRALTACNHLGVPLEARRELDGLGTLEQRLLGRWELVHEIVEKRLAESVHRTDCFEFEAAAAACERLDSYYKELVELFGAGLGAPADRKVVSELRGKALGTWLQAEIIRSAGDAAVLAAARSISDLAQAEFATRADVARQEQYRCFLEAVAGQTEDARRWLARSLDLTQGHEHEHLAAKIAELGGYAQGFALLHWSRIGAALAHDGGLHERRAFHDALRASGLAKGGWVMDDPAGYPAHGIRRYLAVACAGQGQRDEALALLGHMRKLDSLKDRQLVFVVIQVGGMLEVAGLLWAKEPKAARKLLEERDASRPGALQLLEKLTGVLPPTMPMRARLEGWRAEAEALIEPDGDGQASRLIQIGRATWW